MAKTQHQDRNVVPERLELPEGWALVTLGRVCDLNPPKPPVGSVHPDTPVTFVPMAAVDAASGKIANPETRIFSVVRKGFTSFRDSDVIMAKITPCAENGKAAIASGLQNGLGFGSTEFHVLRPTKAVLKEYVYYFIRQESFREAAAAEMTGSVGQKRVPAWFLETASLTLPPIAEQRRIVAEVEALLARVDAARDRLAKVPATLKRFRKSVIAAACSARLTAGWRDVHHRVEPAGQLLKRIRHSHYNAGLGFGGKAADPTEEVHDLAPEDLPETWDLSKLMELCEPGRPIVYGILKPGPDLTTGVPYVRVADFPNDRINQSTVRKTSAAIAKQYSRATLSAGDVLLSIRGTVGRVCPVPKELAGANITQDTARISVHHEVDAEYIAIYLRCPSVSKRFERALRGVAVRGINIGDVRALQIALPPIEEQREIVQRVEALFKLTDTIEKRVAMARARAEKLTQSILAKAFRGELVATEAELARREGREYESASVLLDKIIQEARDGDQEGKSSQRRVIRISSNSDDRTVRA